MYKTASRLTCIWGEPEELTQAHPKLWGYFEGSQNLRYGKIYSS